MNDRFESANELSVSVTNILWVYGASAPAMVETLIKEKYLVASRLCISKSSKCDIICVDNGDHSINALVSEQVQNIITDILD